MMEFIDNVVYCNILRSIKPAFLELEQTMYTGATLIPMFTIIIPGPYSHSKQSKTFHAKCNLKVNCEEKWKMGLITKCDCMSATDINHAGRHLCHVVDVCSKLLKDFHDSFLVNMSDQKVVGIAFSCFWLRNYKKHSFALQHDQ